MATKAERDLEEELGESPWAIYEDRDEPWKDHELMLKLEDKFDYQYEIAHVLGTSPSKISYWMEKARENWNPSLDDERFECEYFEVCGYEAPNPGSLCTTCLDLVRHNQSRESQRGETYHDPEDSDTLVEHMQKLYDTSDEHEVNSP